RIEAPTGADAAAFQASQLGTITLDPEQSTIVRVNFTPSHLGPALATMQVTPCPTCNPLPFVLSGNGVISLLDIEPPRIDFGRVRLSLTKEATFTARNTSKRPTTLTSFSVPAGAYSVP